MRERLGFALMFLAGLAPAETRAVQIVANLESGPKAGSELRLTATYDSQKVAQTGESVVPIVPEAGVTPLRLAEAVFLDGVFQRIRISARLEAPGAMVHNISLGIAGPRDVSYVDQFGRTGLGAFTATPLSQIPPLSPAPVIAPLTVFAPNAVAPAPLFIPSAAAPGLVVFDPAPLTLTLPPPPPNR